MKKDLKTTDDKFLISFSKKAALTLSESLITLMIIGVVAALTIPSLINTYKERQFKTAWKTAYSDLVQAQKLLNADFYENLYGECRDFDDTCLRDLFSRKLSTVKKCEANNISECFARSKFLDGRTNFLIGINDNWPMLITSNGMSMKFRFHKQNCTAEIENCGWIQVDVNGTKGPNTMGKDIFQLDILKDKLDPAPAEYKNISHDEMVNDCKNGTGLYCSKLYLMEK